MTTPGRPPRRPLPRPASRLGGVLLSAALVVPLAGCSDRSQEAPRAAVPSSSAPAPTVETSVRYGAVTGRLPQAERRRLAERVRRVVDGWTAAAYLDGPFRSRDFSTAFAGFTPGARADARRDRALLTNQTRGGPVDEVVPRRSRLVLDVLAVKRRPVGVTARLDLRFATAGRGDRSVRVGGRVYLTPTPDGWRIFGYDLTKGSV